MHVDLLWKAFYKDSQIGEHSPIELDANAEQSIKDLDETKSNQRKVTLHPAAKGSYLHKLNSTI